jgi:hypothetical protein
MRSLLALLLACTSPKGAMLADSAGAESGDSGQDSAAPIAEDCDPFAVEGWQSWLEEDLPALDDRKGTVPGLAAADFDGDGWIDLFVAYGGGAFFLRNDGAGNLVEVDWPLDGQPWTGVVAAAAADLDQDGDMDLYAGRGKGRLDLIATNEGGSWSGVELPGSESTPGNGLLVDLDGDVDLDLAVSGFVDSMDMFAIEEGTQVGTPSLIYENSGAGFALKEGALPASLDTALCFQLSALDADLDGDLDLYMANEKGAGLPENRLLLNDGAAGFTEAPPEAGADLAMASMGSAVGDADGDGLIDLLISDYGPPALLRGMGDGSLVHASAALGVDIPLTDDHATGWGTAFADLDRSGGQDLIVTYGESCYDCEEWSDSPVQYSQLLFDDGSGAFSREEPYHPGFDESGRTRSVVLADLDQDGDADIITVGKHFLRTWRVSGGCPTGLTLQLEQPGPNPAAIGARVEVEAGGRAQSHWLLPQTAHSQGALELVIGLGGWPRAERVAVIWPDGERQELGALAAGRHRVQR